MLRASQAPPEPRRFSLLFFVVLAAPALLCAEVLKPPPQEYVLHFQPNAVAYTDQISLGATFTMETWIFPDAASPGGVFMGKVNSPRGSDPFIHYTIGFNLGKPAFFQTTGQPGTYRAITGPSDLPLNSWTHVAGVLNSGVMRLYVNGQLVASGNSPGLPAGAGVPFGLGGALDGTTTCNFCSFSGALREARVWSRAVSASELQTYATQRLTGNEPGLIADWPLSEGSGQVVHGIGPQAASLTNYKGSANWSRTQLLDNGPYWEIQDLPLVTDATYGIVPAVYINSDHRPDILLAYTPYALDKPTAGPVLFLHNEGKRVFTPVKPAQPSMVFHPRNRTVADFDGDGYEDVVLADHGWDHAPFPGAVTRIFMQRSGQMNDETDSRLPPLVAFTHDVCSGDVNRDGSPDLFFANTILYLNDGKGHFKNANDLLQIFGLGRSPNVLACQFIDVNRDGAAELLLGWPTGPNVRSTLLLNDGKGSLRDVSAQSLPPQRGGPTWATHGFTVVDLNRDGWPDLIVTLAESSFTPSDGVYHTTMQLLINNRDGTFRDQEDAVLNAVRTDGFYDKAYWLDLNQDGWPDLLVNLGNNHHVLLYQNMGGHFEDRTETLPAGLAEGLAADFDGDGRVDIALFPDTHTKMAWGKNLWPPVAMKTPVVTSVSMAGGFPGIVQNGWIQIKGTDLTPLNVGSSGMVWDTAREFASGGMPEQLGGISVTVNGKPAFVYYVSPTQLNVLSPIDDAVGVVPIVVTSGGLSSAPFNVDMRAAAPSFPLFGSNYLVAKHADYTLVGPVALSAPGYPVTPAKPGETIIVYAFGFGLPTTALVNGSSTQSGVLPASPVIQIGGSIATVKFAGVISPGLYMFNAVVPGTAPDGDNLVTCSYNGATAPAGGLIAIQR